MRGERSDLLFFTWRKAPHKLCKEEQQQKGRPERKRVALYTFVGFFSLNLFCCHEIVVYSRETKFTRVSLVEVISACHSNFVFIIGEREKKEFAPLLVFCHVFIFRLPSDLRRNTINILFIFISCALTTIWASFFFSWKRNARGLFCSPLPTRENEMTSLDWLGSKSLKNFTGENRM